MTKYNIYYILIDKNTSSKGLAGLGSIYEVPESIDELFSDIMSNQGFTQYRIIDYSGSGMDNEQSMRYFMELVEIPDEHIEENLGTQITLTHSNYDKRIVIDSGGLGDFFSHGFECNIHEEDI